MPRFYVQKENKWNIFSTIVDDFILDNFVDFQELKKYVIDNEIKELIINRNKELDTLLTEQPVLNTMFYEDAIERINIRQNEEIEEID